MMILCQLLCIHANYNYTFSMLHPLYTKLRGSQPTLALLTPVMSPELATTKFKSYLHQGIYFERQKRQNTPNSPDSDRIVSVSVGQGNY